MGDNIYIFIIEFGLLDYGAEKFNDFPSASCRTRKAGDTIQSKYTSLRTRSQCSKSQSELKGPITRSANFEGRRRSMSQLKERANSPILCRFILFRPSVDWMMPTHIGKAESLYIVY